MKKYWCGVVSKEHIKRGERGGFCQVCHGKKAPLARMAVGDGIVFYSPVEQFQGKDKCQSFTAIGTVVGDSPYLFEMTPTFVPFRRDVRYRHCRDAPIHPLLARLSFTAGRPGWGYQFRLGHFEITEADFLLIEQAMQAGSEIEPVAETPAAPPPGPRQRDLLSDLA
jgi:hypothetical protein